MTKLDNLVEAEQCPRYEVLATWGYLGNSAHQHQDKASGVITLAMEVQANLIRHTLQHLQEKREKNLLISLN